MMSDVLFVFKGQQKYFGGQQERVGMGDFLKT